MFRRLRCVWFTIPVLFLGQALAEGQDLPPAPQPVAVDPNPTPPRVAPIPNPPAQVINAPLAPVLVPPPVAVYQPAPPPDYAVEAAALDAHFAPLPGWFAGFEVGLWRPRVRVQQPSETDIDLDWTASPRVFLGYRFCNGGAFRLAYRNLASSGSDELGLPGIGFQDLHTRLDLNRVDLDFVSREYAPTTHWRLQWELGARLANRFQDERAADPTGRLHIGSDFFGAGPHAGITATWLIGDSGWAWFTRLDGAILFGSDRFHGTFDPSDPLSDACVPPFGFSRRRSETESDGNIETGFSWTKCTERYLVRLSGGIQVEGWSINKDDQNGLFPFAQVSSVGPFIRCELGF
jgi:hypothetical protein